MGHLDRVAAIDAGSARHPGLYVSGNGLRGLSVNQCVEEAATVAEEVLDDLAARLVEPPAAEEG